MDNLAGESTDENNIKGLRKKKLIKIIIKLTKRPMKCNLNLIQVVGYYSSRLGVNMYPLATGAWWNY